MRSGIDPQRDRETATPSARRIIRQGSIDSARDATWTRLGRCDQRDPRVCEDRFERRLIG